MTAGRNIVSASQSWGTPEKYVLAIRKFFGGAISLDPCSNEFSIVNAETEYSLPMQDGLVQSWDFPTIYVNPPYGADRERGTTIKHWLRRCAMAHSDHGSEVLALVPVATNTRHWKECVFGVASAVVFLYDTRLRFLEFGKDTGKGAPMSCCLVYWGGRVKALERAFVKHGAPVDLRGLRGLELGGVKVDSQLKIFANQI